MLNFLSSYYLPLQPASFLPLIPLSCRNTGSLEQQPSAKLPVHALSMRTGAMGGSGISYSGGCVWCAKLRAHQTLAAASLTLSDSLDSDVDESWDSWDSCESWEASGNSGSGKGGWCASSDTRGCCASCEEVLHCLPARASHASCTMSFGDGANC